MLTSDVSSLVSGVSCNVPAERLATLILDLPSESDRKFAQSLCDSHRRYGRLSPKQEHWVGVLIDRATRPKTRIGSFPAITALFRNPGAAALKFPRITFDKSGTGLGHGMGLSLAGARAKVPGSVNVTDGGKFGENVWYGRILPDGKFESSGACTAREIDWLVAFAQDPAGHAAAYGKATGRCCFCRQSLTDDRSTSKGYGPVCAANYGLPWG